MKTIRKLVFIVALFLCGTSTYAQFSVGLKAGYTSSLTFGSLSSVTNGTYNVSSLKSEMWNNFQAGVFGRIIFGKLYIEPELLYTLQKKEYQITFEDIANHNVTLNKLVDVNTIDVPILVGFKVIDLKIANIHVFAGPKLRFLAGSGDPVFKNTDGNFGLDQIVTEAKKSNVGLELGAGVDIFNFTLDARANLISNMAESKLNGKTLASIPSNTLVISLAWKIL